MRCGESSNVSAMGRQDRSRANALVRITRRCETGRDDDPAAVEIDLPHAGLDKRQGRPRVELEHVVHDAGRDLRDPPEGAAALLFDLEADELEGVILALPGWRQLVLPNRELGTACDLPFEPDHGTTARASL